MIGRGALLPIIAGAVGCSFTGASIVATRFVIHETDAITLAFLRYLIGALCLAPIAFWVSRRPTARPRIRMSRRDIGLLLVLGALFFGAFPWAFNLSLVYTTAAHGALVLATAPILTLALASAVRSEAFTLFKTLGVTAGFLGVAIALLGGDQGLAAGPLYWLGDLIMLGAAAIAAIYSVAAKPLLVRHPALLVTCLSMAAGVLALAPLAAWQFAETGLPDISTQGWLAVLFLGIGGGAIQFGLWVWSVSRLTATQASLFLTLTPITAMLLAVLVLNERLTLSLLVGLVLVVFAIRIANRRPGAKAADKAAGAKAAGKAALD